MLDRLTRRSDVDICSGGNPDVEAIISVERRIYPGVRLEELVLILLWVGEFRR